MFRIFVGLVQATSKQRSLTRRIVMRHSSTSVSDAKAPARELWRANNLPDESLSRLHLSEHADPKVDSSFKLGSTAQTVIGLSGLSAAHFHELRTSVQQDVSVDSRHAVIEFKSETFYTIDGQPGPRSIWDPLAGIYQTKNGGYVRIHTNFPQYEIFRPIV